MPDAAQGLDFFPNCGAAETCINVRYDSTHRPSFDATPCPVYVCLYVLLNQYYMQVTLCYLT